MPSATHSQIQNINNLVLVQWSEIRDRGQRFASNNFESEQSQYEREVARDTLIGRLHIKNKQRQSENGDKAVERVDIHDVVAWIAGHIASGHYLWASCGFTNAQLRIGLIFWFDFWSRIKWGFLADSNHFVQLKGNTVNIEMPIFQ